jgi:hypothetical protein
VNRPDVACGLRLAALGLAQIVAAVRVLQLLGRNPGAHSHREPSRFGGLVAP